MAKSRPRPASKGKKRTLEFHFKKSANHRTYHVDGAFGGLTPRGGIYVDFYVEHLPTPQVITQVVGSDGTLGQEVGRASKEGIIRDIECGITMDIHAAKAFRDWLDRKIVELDSLLDKGLIGPAKNTTSKKK